MKLLTHMLQTGGIPLTKSGGFIRKYVERSAEEFQWPGFTADDLYAVNRVLNEYDFPPLALLHDLLLSAKVIRHYKNTAVATKIGAKLEGDLGSMQALLFETYFAKLDLSIYERFPIADFAADFRHIIWVTHNRLDDWVALSDYASWCLPIELFGLATVSPLKEACFYMMSNVTRPLNWFGLLDRSDEEFSAPIEKHRVRRTPLFDKFIKLVTTTSRSSNSH